MVIETKEIYAILTWKVDEEEVAYRIVGWEGIHPLIVDERNLVQVQEIIGSTDYYEPFWHIAFGPLPSWIRNPQILLERETK